MSEPKKQTIGHVMQENAMMKADIKVIAHTFKEFLDEMGIDLSQGDQSMESVLFKLTSKLPTLLSGGGDMKSFYKVKALAPMFKKYAYLFEEDGI